MVSRAKRLPVLAILGLGLVGALAVASCKSGDEAPQAAAVGPEQARTETAAAAAPAAPAGGEAGDGAADQAAQPKPAGPAATGATPARARKIIRTGTLLIEVGDHAAARRAIEQLVRSAGGFIAGVEVGRNQGAMGSATLTLRIPEPELDGALARLAALGTLRQESIRAEDVSETYYDLASRLRNAKRLEERMLELSARAGGVKDLLEVEREVGRVRESIELMEGQLRGLDDRASLATLTVALTTRQVYVPEEQIGLGGRIAGAFDGSLRALAAAAEASLLFLVAALPWLIPVAAGAWFLRRRLLRRRP
jgi:Domain of unknown function (DUF4349)